MMDAEAVARKAIPGFEGLYEADDQGNIYSLERVVMRRRKTGNYGLRIPARQMALGKTRKGYKNVSLHRDNRAHPKEVHRLICETFHGPAPVGMEAAHQNGDRSDNRADNLRWSTRSTNSRDRWRHGTMLTGESVPNSKLTAAEAIAIFERAVRGESQRALARQFGISEKAVRKIKTGETWFTETAAVRAILKGES